jgi:hypothetical protein
MNHPRMTLFPAGNTPRKAGSRYRSMIRLIDTSTPATAAGEVVIVSGVLNGLVLCVSEKQLNYVL